MRHWPSSSVDKPRAMAVKKKKAKKKKEKKAAGPPLPPLHEVRGSCWG